MDERPPARLKADTSRGFTPATPLDHVQTALSHEIARADGELARFEVHPGWLSALRRDAYVINAHASASLEGNPLTLEQATDAVRRSDARAWNRPAPDEREILQHVRYFERLSGATAAKGAPSVEEVEATHRELLHGVLPRDKQVGRVRGPDNRSEAYFGANVGTPPDRVRAELDALATWYDGEGRRLPPPVRVAAWVHEFLSIHPFRDGNGRVARALAHRLLRSDGLPNARFVALDRPFHEDRKAYTTALDAGRDGSLAPWVTYFLRCLHREYRSASEFLVRATSVPSSLRGAARAVLEHVLRSGASTVRLVELRRALPSYRPITLSLALAALAREHGLLRHNGQKGRGSAYEASDDLLRMLGGPSAP